jgi:hypothetical protein
MEEMVSRYGGHPSEAKKNILTVIELAFENEGWPSGLRVGWASNNLTP